MNQRNIDTRRKADKLPVAPNGKTPTTSSTNIEVVGQQVATRIDNLPVAPNSKASTMSSTNTEVVRQQVAARIRLTNSKLLVSALQVHRLSQPSRVRSPPSNEPKEYVTKSVMSTIPRFGSFTVTKAAMSSTPKIFSLFVALLYG